MVTTGGSFVASTLDVSNEDFLNGGDLTFEGDSQAGVTNLGTVPSAHGDVVLLGQRVVNQGSLVAGQGMVGLGAGQRILLREEGN
ncbi:filamentous hemagglutinin, partial [Burkholderia sp. SIMBA_024]